MRKFYSFLIALLAVCGLAQAQVTFDFSGDDAYEQFGLAGFSSSESGDGDITEDVSATSGDVTVTVSPCEGRNPNRMWTGSLRMYGGTLTIASKGKNITSISFILNSSKWGDANTANVGTLTKGAWSGDADEVVITIAGNTQIKSLTVNFDGTTPDPIDWTSSAEEPMDVPTVLERAAELQTGQESDVDVYVVGMISSITYQFDAQHGTAPFKSSDDGTENEEFTIYGTYYLGNRNWKEGDKEIKVGDDVIICGRVTKFSDGTLEMASKKSYIYSLNGEVGQIVEAKEYTKIADMKTDATDSKEEVVYKAREVLVTFVNGSSVYVSDGEDGMLLYGKNSGIKTGDKVSFSVKGELYLFNGLTEIAVSAYEDLTVISSDNEVAVQQATIADVKNNYAKYENELVTIEELTPAEEAWDSNRRVVFTDDSDNEIALRDNFSIATELTFNKEATYTITGFVARYKKDADDEIRIFPRSAADIDDGEEPVPFVAEGEGTMQKPYTIKDVKGILANNLATEKPVWAHGFIVASANGSLDQLVFTAGDDAIVSNVMLATSKDATQKADMIPVALPTGKVREALNLKDNAGNLGREVWLYGTIEAYFKVAGLKNITDFSFDGKTHISDVNAATSAGAIYNIAGQRMQSITTSGLYIVGNKKVVVK